MESRPTGNDAATPKEVSMSDEMKHKAESGLGKAKEKLGDATDDKSLEAEGKRDQSKSDLKQAGDKVKDAFKR
jgi:uncharacterized protein YjbJ (UPF0337 family)